MPLTDAAVRNAKPKESPYSVADGAGLSLLVQPSGGKWWRFRYRFFDRPRVMSFGTYPDIGLREARSQRDAARKLLTEGIDPGEKRKEEKAERELQLVNTFEAVTREWAGKKASTWTPAYGERLIRRFEHDVFPLIGARPIADIRPKELLSMLRKIEARGALETAHRARSECGQVFRYAIATDRAERDIAADLVGALEPKKVKHFAAVTLPGYRLLPTDLPNPVHRTRKTRHAGGSACGWLTIPLLDFARPGPCWCFQRGMHKRL